MMVESNAEYSTLAICTDMLEIALTGDRDILHFLEQEGYNIPDDVSNSKSMLSDQEKAGLVVTAIKDKVSLNSRNYQKLLDHFHFNERVYGDIITVLEQAYNKLGSHPKDQPSVGYGKTAISQCSISIYQKTKLFFGRFIYEFIQCLTRKCWVWHSPRQGFIYWGVRGGGGIFPPKSSIFPLKNFYS